MKQYPFKFLDAYDKEDKAIFFGREEEIEELYRLVFKTNLLLLYGASGTGKTSLIRCGLANRFRPSQWLDLYIRRGSDINQSLLDTIVHNTPKTAEVGDETEELDWFESVVEVEKRTAPAATETPVLATSNPTAKALHELYLADFTPIYLIFDQFEELYTLGQPEEQRQLVETIAELVRLPIPLKIIIVMREEYLANLYELEKAVPQLRNKKLRVEPMDLPRVEQVILNATTRNPNSNIELEAGKEAAVAKAIIEKIRERDVNVKLPYLQVFMDRLYESATGEEIERSQEALLTLDMVEQMGDIGDVLVEFIERQSRRIYQTLAEKYPNLPAGFVWKMLSPFATVEGTKAPIRKEALSTLQVHLDLPDAPWQEDLIKETIAELESSRILRYRTEERAYELTHDTLARQIHARRSDEEIALLEVRRLIKSQTAIKVEAREFFSEKQLNFIEPYLPKFQLTAEEADWIAQSRAYVSAQKEAEARRQAEELAAVRKRAEEERKLREEAQRSENRARQRTSVAWIFSILALFIAALAYWQYKEAQNQKDTADLLAEIAQDSAQAAREQRALAIDAQRIAQDSAKAAREQRALAITSEERTKKALSDLKITAAQAVNLLLAEADRSILKLDYDGALEKCRGALNLGERKPETYRRLQEIAFFFTESGRYGGADSTLQLISRQEAPLERARLLEKIRDLNPLHYERLQKRYYPEMIEVAGGTFMMGDDLGDKNEKSVDAVRLDRFLLAKTETTVWQYYLYTAAAGLGMPETPTWQWSGDHPIVRTSWYDALDYANWVNSQKGLEPIAIREGDGGYRLRSGSPGYRLPTEAEWEYAARGGSAWQDGFPYAGGDSIDLIAWYSSNSDSRPHTTGTKAPNQLGLYDMSGNVWEWCWDWYDSDYYQQVAGGEAVNPKGPTSGSFRVIRSGSWGAYPEYCRTAFRADYDPVRLDDDLGFRLVFVP